MITKNLLRNDITTKQPQTQCLRLFFMQILLSDKVSFVCPEQSDYDTKINDFIDSKSLWYSDVEEAVERLINHGMTRNEAESYVGKTNKMSNYLENNKSEVAFTRFKGKTITFGWKRRA